VDAGVVKELTVAPEDVGLARAPQKELGVDSLAGAADLIRRLLSTNEQGPPRSMLLLNASAAIVAGGAAESLAEGVAQAKHSVDSGAAARALESLVRASTSAAL
jgi:anthranilate phosphoribosyltransferase